MSLFDKLRKRREPTILFLHIPKTAGRTLNRIIRGQYPRETLFATSRAVSGALGDDWRKKPVAERWTISRDTLRSLPEEHRRHLRAVYGHMLFGWHQWLPGPSTYCTVLREPLERSLSSYYFIKRSVEKAPEHFLYYSLKEKHRGIAAFVYGGADFTMDNGQVRILSGLGDTIPYGACTRQHLDRARANLEAHFSVIGIQEAFDLSLELFCKTFGWPIEAYSSENVNPDRPTLDTLSRDDRRALEEFNHLDRELYAHARQRFHAQLTAADLPLPGG